MNLAEILESRREPTLNVKDPGGHESALSFFKNIPQKNIEKYGISMTSLPKLGVNPGSEYKTPIGIYFYPALYYTNVKDHGSKLEFLDDAPYIQIFRFSGNILEISSMQNDEYIRNIEALISNADLLATLSTLDKNNIVSTIKELVEAAGNEARIKTPGGYLWFVTHKLSGYLSEEKWTSTSNVEPVLWNKLFRILKYDVIIDYGESIIHTYEPTQGVVINPRAVELVKSITNKASDDAAIWQDIAKLEPYNMLHKTIQTLNKTNLRHVRKSVLTEVKKIGKILYDYIIKNPASFVTLLGHERDTLLYIMSPQMHKSILSLALETEGRRAGIEQFIEELKNALNEKDYPAVHSIISGPLITKRLRELIDLAKSYGVNVYAKFEKISAEAETLITAAKTIIKREAVNNPRLRRFSSGY